MSQEESRAFLKREERKQWQGMEFSQLPALLSQVTTKSREHRCIKAFNICSIFLGDVENDRVTTNPVLIIQFELLHLEIGKQHSKSYHKLQEIEKNSTKEEN